MASLSETCSLLMPWVFAQPLLSSFKLDFYLDSQFALEKLFSLSEVPSSLSRNLEIDAIYVLLMLVSTKLR